MLAGKRALVTGSIGGLGHAIAGVLANHGADVVLHGLCRQDEGEAIAGEMARRSGRDARFEQADLRQPDEIAAMMARLLAAGVAPDIVVNNAAVRHQAPIADLDPGLWDETIAVNLSACFHVIRLAAPAMRQRGWGRIINIASVLAHRAEAERIGYVTTKTALLGLTRAVAVELAPTGITCNAVVSGTVKTEPIVAKIARSAAARGMSQDQAENAYIAARHPTEKFVDARDIGEMVAFLCGPAASGITGASLPVDGGWTARS